MIGKLFMGGVDYTRAQVSKFIRAQRSLLNDSTSITINTLATSSVHLLGSVFRDCTLQTFTCMVKHTAVMC